MQPKSFYLNMLKKLDYIYHLKITQLSTLESIAFSEKK